MTSDNFLSHDKVRRQLVDITRWGEGDYMNVDALNSRTAAKIGQGWQIKFLAKLFCMKDLLDILEVALSNNK